MVGVYAGGSYALGDYLPGRSDLDVAAVVRSHLPAERAEAVVASLRHEALPSPAARLELVVYRAGTARSSTATRDFELNLNTGEGIPLLLQRGGASGEVGWHWFPIDRSVLAQAGVAIFGPPARELFAPISPAELAPVLCESVRWHREHPGPSDAVLNACRALRFAEESRWSSKPAAGRWAAQRGLAPGNLVAAALKARTEGGALDPAEVAAFLSGIEKSMRRDGRA